MAPTASRSGSALAPCPNSPNCVSSQATDDAHSVEPFRFTGDAEDAWKALKLAVLSLGRTVVAEESDGYLRAEATSRIFRFVDDVEFLMRAEEGIIHVRSASRVGYGDLGVNRRRVERIRRMLREAGVVSGD